MAAPVWLIRRPVPNQLGGRVSRTSVANQRLRGSARLRRIFRPDAARWPNRAGARYAPAQPRNLTRFRLRVDAGARASGPSIMRMALRRKQAAGLTSPLMVLIFGKDT